jgi:cytochrome c oxidase subunit IV
MLDPQILICSAAGAIQYLRWYVNILFEILKTGIFVQLLYHFIT